MKTSLSTPTFAANYAVVIKKAEQYRANRFAVQAQEFVATHNNVVRNKVQLTTIDLPNIPESTMFVFSLPNHLAKTFEEFAEGAKVKPASLDRLG